MGLTKKILSPLSAKQVSVQYPFKNTGKPPSDVFV